MMGTLTRRTRHKEKMRQDILDAARELFVAEGYDNVSMRKIGERIEYSPTIIYHYFQDKADLVYCLIEETFSRMLFMLRTLTETCADPLECLSRSGRAFVNFGLTYPNYYRMAFMVEIHPKDEQEKSRYLRPESPGIQTFAFLRRLVEECVRTGKFRAVDIELTTQHLFAVVHGITALLITHPEFPWAARDHLIDYVIESALKSFTAT
jgi:AcrR family transcriptional regulator